MTDTIFALATAPGRGGVAVIRVSGPDSIPVAQALTDKKLPEARVAAFSRFRHPETKAILDTGLLLIFKGPASFTGEDVAEFHCHGGPAIVRAFLDTLGTFDTCRMAEPGEFTRRAYENGKLDLTAAEAVADLIDAETEQQRLQAFQQMEGALATLYNGWAERLTKNLAYLEASIDFTDEEDVSEEALDAVRPALEELLVEIAEHLEDKRSGERLRTGVRVAVIGAPNVGKSSLVNALAQREVAIVSEQAGTTRDIIDAHLDIGGYPVILSDTAGLRPDQIGDKGQDAIEQEGIRRALEVAREADIRCLVFDQSRLPDMDSHSLEIYEDALAAGEEDRILVIFNKADEADTAVPDEFERAVSVSAQTGAGLSSLSDALYERVESFIGRRSGPALTRERHREALLKAKGALQRALDVPAPELMAEDLRLSVRNLGRITGKVDVEDLLDVIFRDFCLGK